MVINVALPPPVNVLPASVEAVISKLSNSTPRPGTWMPFADREVTEKDKEQHEKWRCNYDAMKQLISYHPDYQMKPVISSLKDLGEVKELQKILDVPNDKVWLMPEGINEEQLSKYSEQIGNYLAHAKR